MDLQSFLNQFDTTEAVILLEGKRKVKKEDEPQLIKLGQLLASSSQHMKFRSGNAPGADALFSEGVASVNPDRLEVVVPYKTHRQKELLTKNIISLDDIDLTREDKLVQLSKKNKSVNTLIDKYLAGHRNNFTHKAEYLLRDTLKVTGAKHVKPTSFAFFYDDLEKPKSGGTGHTMMACDFLQKLYVDQNVWSNWI